MQRRHYLRHTQVITYQTVSHEAKLRQLEMET